MTLSHKFSHNSSGKLLLFMYLILSVTHVYAGSFNDLNETYEEVEDDLLENIYDIPIYLESEVTENAMRGDVYGIIYHPYKKVSENLASLSNWCEIMPQHLNIKACTYQYINDKCKLTFYSGRKFYEKADDVYQLDYEFNVPALDKNYFNASLNSKEGPIDTTDYLINVEAIPLTNNTTFFYLTYEYKYGFWTRLGMSTYFSTLGSGKVGFTVEDKDEEGNPIYVEGVRGVIERNSMRYYFAIQSYLDTQKDPIEIRFKRKISNWFDLTEKHHKQLYEMDKKDYLKYKNKERQDQVRLQKSISSNKVTFANTDKACLSLDETEMELFD